MTTDNLQLPGIPPVPAKRGRPSSGKSLTDAQRKRISRQKARERQVQDYKTLTDSQLCEAVSREIATIKRYPVGEDKDNAKWHYNRLILELNVRVSKL